MPRPRSPHIESHRAALYSLAALAALAVSVAAGPAAAGLKAGGRSRQSGGNPPRSGPTAAEALAYHVLDRVTYGYDDAALDEIRQLGVDAFLLAQLAPERLPESPELAARLTALLPPRYTPFGDPLWLWDHLIAAHLLRARYSSRQLNEVMTEFWRNHFNTEATDFSNAATGLFTSLALDPAGQPFVALYAQATSVALGAYKQGATWRHDVIDGYFPTGWYQSAGVDPATGLPMTAYYQPSNGPNGNLRVTRFDGAAWTPETVDSDGDVGAWASLAHDPQGRARIAYHDGGNGELKLATSDAGSWTLEVVAPGGLFASLDFDGAGRPVVGHYDPAAGAIAVSRWDGSRWSTTYPTAIDPTLLEVDRKVRDRRVLVRLLSLAVDPATGEPAVAFREPQQKELCFARFDGSSWQVETVDATGDVGRFPSLAFSPADGRPAIAYYSSSESHLRFAAHDGAAWSATTIGPLDEVTGEWNGLAFDPAGTPHISFYNGSRFGAQLARRAGAVWEIEDAHLNDFRLAYRYTDWTAQDVEFYRANALGRFHDLLRQSATSAAMMTYLNNDENFAGAGNENYGRELLELHTVGVDGGYDQTDVEEASKIMTGWGVERKSPRCDIVEDGFCYNHLAHDGRPHTVMGRTFDDDSAAVPSNWMKQGDELLEFLAYHPSTARFVCGKLIAKFTGDEPPDRLWDRCRQRFLQTGGDIREVLHLILFSDEFRDPARFAAKVRTPLEWVLAAVRALAGDTDGESLYETLRKQGQPLFRVPPPTGYEEAGFPWLSPSVVLDRWRFADQLLNDAVATTVDPLALVRPTGLERADAVVKFFARRLLRGRIGPGEMTAALACLNDGDPGPIDLFAPDVDRKLRETVQLLLGLPEAHKQ